MTLRIKPAPWWACRLFNQPFQLEQFTPHGRKRWSVIGRGRLYDVEGYVRDLTRLSREGLYD